MLGGTSRAAGGVRASRRQRRHHSAASALGANCFHGQRAAFRKTAAWEYPIDESPADEVLLPDVQGSRQLVFGGQPGFCRQSLRILPTLIDDLRFGMAKS